MTFSRLDAMQEYWRDHPPLHLMVAAYLGIKPPKTPEPSDLSELFGMFPISKPTP